MNTIDNNVENMIIIKNSKFITFLYYIDNIEQVDNYINIVKNKYENATHYCYGYMVGNNIKCSDDKEPSGTAGRPILDVLIKNNLNNILAIVVRYFGGIKLGSNGLIRAYSHSISDALNKTKVVKLIRGKNIDIYFDYKDVNDINLLLSKCNINTKNYEDNIHYNADIPYELVEVLSNKYKVIINSDTHIKMI